MTACLNCALITIALGAGVLAGMLGGFVASVAWLTWFKADFHGLYEAIPGFVVGMILTFGVSYMTSSRETGARV